MAILIACVDGEKREHRPAERNEGVADGEKQDARKRTGGGAKTGDCDAKEEEDWIAGTARRSRHGERNEGIFCFFAADDPGYLQECSTDLAAGRI